MSALTQSKPEMFHNFVARPPAEIGLPAEPNNYRLLRTPEPTRLFDVAYSTGGELLAAAGEDGQIWLWDLPLERRASFGLNSRVGVRTLTFADHGRSLVAAGGDWLRGIGELAVWDHQQPDRKRTLWRHTRPISVLAQRPNGGLVAGTGDGLLRVWRQTSGDGSAPIQAHEDEISSIRFAANGQLAITGSADQSVKLWNADLTHQSTLHGHDRVVTSVALSSDGTLAASADIQTILLWDVATGRQIEKLETPCGSFRTLAFTPDSRCLLSGGAFLHGSAELRRWDLRDGSNTILFRRPASISAVAVDPSGTSLAAADYSGAVQLWPLRN